MKKHLLLAAGMLISLSASAALVVPTGPDGENLPPYDDAFDASTNNVYCTSLTVSSTDPVDEPLVLTVNQRTDNRKYFNFTNQVFRAYPGSTVSIAWTGQDQGRHNSRAVFVDWNQNLQFDGEPGVETTGYAAFVNIINDPEHAEIKENVELVAFEVCSPQKCTPTGTRGDFHGTYSNPMTFVIPEGTLPGKYLVRQTNAWNNLNPANTDNGNGISVIDFYLEVPYPPYQSATLNPDVAKSGTGRYTGNVIVSFTNLYGQSETLTINDLQDNTASDKAYYDKSDMVFTAKPGSTFSLSNNVGEGSGGMQKYLFIDWNQDRKFGPDDADNFTLSHYVATEAIASAETPLGTILTPEFVFYHALKYANAGTWYHTTGVMTNQSVAYNLSINNISIPEGTPEGDYRIRYKYSWNDANPYAPAGAGGIVVDFTLRVRNTIDYTLDFGGVTVSATATPGATINIEDISGSIPPYFVASEQTFTVPTDGGTVTIPGEWRLPFEFDKPYYLYLRQTTGSGYHHIYYNGTNMINKNVAAANRTLNPYLVWYFKDGGIVNNAKTVTLHSISTEENQGIQVDSTSGSACIISDDEEGITKFAVHNNGDGFSLRVVTDNNASLNDYGNNGTVKVWNDTRSKTDAGSRFWATELTDDDFNVTAWTDHDGLAHNYKADKLENARGQKTLEALRELFVISSLTREDVISTLSGATACNTLRTRMVQTGLFDSNAATEAIIDALNVPQESDDFEAVLEAKGTELGELTASKLVTKFLNGKKVMFKCNGWYFKKGLTKGDSNVTIDAAWEFIADNADKFMIRNAADGKYANGLGVTDNIDDACHYLLANETTQNNGSFAIQNPGYDNPEGANRNYLNNNTGNNYLRYFAAAQGNGQSFWTIHLVTPEMEQTWLTNAINAVSAQEGMTFGDEPGMFTDINPEARAAKLSELQAMSAGNINYPAVYAVNRSDYFTLFDLNGLEGPALIQMAYTPGTDASSYNSQWSGKNQVIDSNSVGVLAFGNEGSTFVLHNGKLHSYNNGLGIVHTASGPAMFTGEEWADNADAMEVDFCNVNKTSFVTAPDNTHRQTYAIKEAGTNNTFGGTSSDYKITWGQNAGMPENNFAYTVWYVKELTINVAQESTKLWRTPVAVSFKELFSNAYVVSVDGTEITTSQVEMEETVYGAGTIFLLTGDATLNVHNGDTTEAVAAGVGHHAKQIHTLRAGKVYLYIHTDDSQEAARVAAMKVPSIYAEPELPTVKMDVIVPEQDTQKLLEAHEALIETDVDTETDPELRIKDGETMDLAMGGTTTVAISEITVKEADANVVYDLMGRRMAAPVKGINIINGKKIMVK